MYRVDFQSGKITRKVLRERHLNKPKHLLLPSVLSRLATVLKKNLKMLNLNIWICHHMKLQKERKFNMTDKGDLKNLYRGTVAVCQTCLLTYNKRRSGELEVSVMILS